MKNQIFIGTPTSPRFSKCPTTVKAGDAVLLGTVPAVALDDYQANEGGTTFYLNGTFALTVIGRTVESPATGHAINAGDKLFASGTLDSATNVTTALTIDAASGNTPFGVLDPQYPSAPVASNATDTAAWVRL